MKQAIKLKSSLAAVLGTAHLDQLHATPAPASLADLSEFPGVATIKAERLRAVGRRHSMVCSIRTGSAISRLKRPSPSFRTSMESGLSPQNSSSFVMPERPTFFQPTRSDFMLRCETDTARLTHQSDNSQLSPPGTAHRLDRAHMATIPAQ
jgi:hypothetical protein